MTTRHIPIRQTGKVRTCATLDEIQLVWALVTCVPTITIREIMAELHMKNNKVRNILIFLEQAGYIQHKARQTGCIVVIPFAIIQPARSL